MKGLMQPLVSDDSFHLDEQQRSPFISCELEVTTDSTNDTESDDGKELYCCTYTFLNYQSVSVVLDIPIVDDVAELAQAQIRQHIEGPILNTYRPLDLEEERKTQQFHEQGCGCKLLKSGPCSSLFSVEHYMNMRANAAELSWAELNMVVMGQVVAFTCLDDDVLNSSKYRHAQKGREKCSTLFHHQGHRVCRKTFLFLHGIGEFRFKAVKGSYLAEGMVPRVHKRAGHIAHNALLLDDIQTIIQFVLEYAEANAIVLPGRVPGYKRDDIQILPSSTTKRAIWRLYQDTATTLSKTAVAYSTWCKAWKQFLPHVVVARPITDLCWTCQQNSTAIIRSANLREEVKSGVSVRACTCIYTASNASVY